jgi:hypothetical protein
MSLVSTTPVSITQAPTLKELASIFVPTLATLSSTPLALNTIPITLPLDHDMGVGKSEGGGIEGDGLKEGRVQGMELVISPMQDEAMALGVGGVHEANPQEEAMVSSLGGVHEVDVRLDVTSPLTPAIVLVNCDSNQLEFSPSCHEVESKRVKEIMDQVLDALL